MVSCIVIITTSRRSIVVSVRPPWRSVRMFDWKPTDVKNASMNMSLSVPSNDTSIWNMVMTLNGS